MSKANKIQLITGSTYPAAATQIAGSYYEKYDSVLQPFLMSIVDMHAYIVIAYPYVFTGNHNLSWQIQTDINKHIQLDYKPNVPNYFYAYHEIYKTFLAKPREFQHILNIGMEHGFIECLNYLDILTSETKIHFIGTDKSTSNFQQYIKLNPRLSKHKHIQNEPKLTNVLYNLLELDFGSSSNKPDLLVFNYYTFIHGIYYNFAFLHSLANYVIMLLALKTLAVGGSLIFHMYAIINKSSADVFVILREYFETAELYYPESSNEYFATGTWAIFTGFKGIEKRALDKLYGVLDEIKKIYPQGMLDINIYDEHIREKCRVFKQIDNTIPHDYIQGYLPNYKDSNKVYNHIREFNNSTYARKYKFTNMVYKLAKQKQYPSTYLLPTYEQSQASVNYLKKWGFGYSLNNVLGTEPMQDTLFDTNIDSKLSDAGVNTYLVRTEFLDNKQVDAEFKKRGNWVKFDHDKHTKIDFFYVDGAYKDDRSLYGIKSGLANQLEPAGLNEQLAKDKLYKTLIKIPGAGLFLPWTVAIDIKDKPASYLKTFEKYFEPGRPLICKLACKKSYDQEPILSSSSLSRLISKPKNIIIVNRFQDFQDFMEEQMASYKRKPAAGNNRWVLQEYIDNPYLIKGRKFHIQLALIYQPGAASSGKESYYMHHSRLALAESPYVQGKWSFKAIHNTRFRSKEVLDWPYDFALKDAQLKHIYEQYDLICSSIISSIKPACGEAATDCFQVFGVDLLLTKDLTVKLLDIDSNISGPATKVFKKKYFDGILNLVVDEHFKPLNRPPIFGNFFKVNRLDSRKNMLTSAKTKKLRNNKIRHWVEFDNT